MDHSRNNKPIQNERNNLSKPQIFVQLAFGVSWSQRHTPQTHTVTYMSRNLKNARDSGNFPRQVPPPTTNYLAVPEHRQQWSREHSSRHHQQRQQSRQQQQQHTHQSHAPTHTREHGRPRGQTGDQPGDQSRTRPRLGSWSETRGALHERGRSAPPPFNGSPWDVYPAPTATIFSHHAQAGEGQSQAWKALPAPPSQYRLGEDGLPWSAWAPPADSQDDGGDALPYANNPTTVSLATERPRSETLDRARELESLSSAMMTVDNGFENQWWYQGPRESVGSWWPHEAGEEEEDDEARTLTTAEALLLSNSEPPSALEPGDDHLASLHALVSPISDTSSPAQSFARPLYRSLTTRSEELWLGR
ncbi:hypothetical protein F4677DRAFT_449895 [Hypoxylon crocopeplum]|nr:hypothetical protein F4677DRAFT_449895 [Hypoxylon crocopeplum]